MPPLALWVNAAMGLLVLVQERKGQWSGGAPTSEHRFLKRELMAVVRRGTTRHDMPVRRPTEGMVTSHLWPFDSMGVGIFRHGQAHATLGAKRSWVASSSDHKFSVGHVWSLEMPGKAVSTMF